MNDFRKYATGHLKMNGMVLDDVMKAQAQYLNPYILEERQLNVTQMDVFSRLMMDRIIFLLTHYKLNCCISTLWMRVKTSLSTSIVPVEVLRQVWAFTTRCSLFRATWLRYAQVWQHRWLRCCSFRDRKENVRH